MKSFIIYLTLFFFSIGNLYAEKERIPDDHKWGQSGERNNTSPLLYQDDAYVYVYSEKQLDSLYIGITDMQGNIFYEEITIVPAGQYYAIPIDSLPNGMYYLSVILGDGVETLTVSSW